MFVKLHDNRLAFRPSIISIKHLEILNYVSDVTGRPVRTAYLTLITDQQMLQILDFAIMMYGEEEIFNTYKLRRNYEEK